MTKNKKKLRRAERRYSVSRTAQTLVLTGLLLAGGVGSANAAEYDPAQDFTAGTDYSSTKGGPADTVVVTKQTAVITGSGSAPVTISAPKGLKIDGGASTGGVVLSVGTSSAQGVVITNGALSLNADTSKNATLTLGGTASGDLTLVGGEAGATITGTKVSASTGTNTITVTKGTLGAYTDSQKTDVADLTISGPITVTVAGSGEGKLAAANLTLDGAAALTNSNKVTVDGIGGDNKLASLDILGGSTYTGDIEVAAGEVRLQEATVTGAVTMTTGSIEITSAGAANDTTTLTSLTVSGTDDAGEPLTGGTVTVSKADLVVTGALKVDHDFAEFSLDDKSELTANSLVVSSGFVDLQGKSTITATSAITAGGLLWVNGVTSMDGALTVGDAGSAGGSVVVRDGGTLHLKADSTTLASGHLEVKKGGILKLDLDKILTVAGDPVDTPSAGMGRNVELYDASGFATGGSIAGKVDVTSGELAFDTAVDLTNILIDGGTADAANGKITISAASNDAGEVAASQGLTYTKAALALGDAKSTLMSGDFKLGDTTGTGDFTMTKGKLLAIGDITVGNGTTNKLTLTTDSSLDLIQASTETKTVGAGTIDVAAGTMNVLLGNWAVKDVTTASGGSLNVGTTDPTKGGAANLTIKGELDTATGSGAVTVTNGTLNLDGTVKTANGNITVDDLGTVSTDLSTAYNGSSLATGFGTVQGTGLLTLNNDSGSDTMSLADYKTLTTTLQGSHANKVGVTVEGLKITGTENATLDASGGVNVAGVSLLDVVASVKDTAVALDGNRTDLKGLTVDNAGTTITLGQTTVATLTLKGGEKGFDLDKGGIANMDLKNNSILNLGTMAGSKTYGDLSGDVKLSSANATLNAVNGEFRVGAVTARVADNGIVKAQGASLTAKSIGAAGAAVASVEANNGGTLSSLADIVTNDLVVNSGMVKAVKDIAVTNAVTGLNGTILSTEGDVILTAGASNASGVIEATKGSITATGQNLSAKAGEKLTLVAGDTITAAAVTATNLQAKTLTTSAATGNVALTDGILSLTGTAADASIVGGTLDLSNTQAGVKELTVKGLATIDGGSLNGNKVTLEAGGTIDNGAQVGIKDLILGAALTVGNADKTESGNTFLTADKTTIGAHTLEVRNATAHLGTLADGTSGKIFVDPAYVNIASVGANFGGSLLAGDQGVITIGNVNEAWVKKAITDAKAPSDSSVLGIQKSLALGTGSIVVDKDVTASGNIGNAASPPSQKVYFGNKSLLAIDGSQFLDSTKGAAIVGNNSSIFIQKTGTEQARLHITNVKTNDTVHVLSDVTGVDTTATAGNTVWNNSNISFNTQLFYGEGVTNATNTAYNVKVNSRGAGNIFPKLSTDMAGLVDNVMAQHGMQENSNNAGVRFMSRAVSDNYGLGGSNAEQAAATIEGAAQLAVVGAAPAMTISAATAGTSAATTRTSFATPLMDSSRAVAMHQSADGSLSLDSGLSAGDSMKTGLGLWIMPLYQSNNVWGMKSGDFKGGYTSDLGGVALGADYTIDDSLRFGLAFNLGGGYAQSKGDFNSTDNSFNFWGINLYGGWTQNNFGLSGDVGYTSTYNKMKQELPSAMQMGDIKSDVTSRAWTAGLRGEYKFATEALDIIPHVGVRYLGLTTDNYKAKSAGDTVFKVDEDFQNIWTFPVGLTFTKEITNSSGWSFRPQLDLGVTPAAGDVKAKSRVRIPGVDGSAEMKMQVMDYISYDGGVGLEMKKDNVSFGVNYNIQASEHRTGHGVFGTFRYEF